MNHESSSEASQRLLRTLTVFKERYFGTKAPEGKESNWIPTKVGGIYEVAFRGPTAFSSERSQQA